MDEQYHLELVKQILSGSLPPEPYFRAPLYPYFLAGVVAVTGDTIWWPRLIQMFLGALLPVLLAVLGRRLFGWRTGLAAGVIAAVYPSFLFYEGSLLIESVFPVAVVLLLLQLDRCAETFSPRALALTGILLGVTALLRPNMLMFGAGLFAWCLVAMRSVSDWKVAVRRYLILLISCAAIIVPVTLRNYVVSGDPVLIAWQGGVNFYVGNHRGSNGWSAGAPEFGSTWESLYSSPVAIAERQSGGGALRRSDVSDYWYSQGWADIKQDVPRACGHLLHKIRLLMNGYEIPNDFSIYAVRDYSPLLRPLVFAAGIFFPFGILLPLSLAGILFSIRNWKRLASLYLFLIAYSATLVIFFVNARFREPMLPVLILFAAYGVGAARESIRNRKWPLVVAAGIVLLFAAIESNSYRLEVSADKLYAYDLAQLAKASSLRGDTPAAVAGYRRALERYPNYADAAISLGYLYVQQKKLPEARDLFRRSIAMDSSNTLTYLNYSGVLADLGELDAAVDQMRAAIRKFPANDTLHTQLGFFLARRGDKGGAIEELNEALRINPNNTSASRLLQGVQAH